MGMAPPPGTLAPPPLALLSAPLADQPRDSTCRFPPPTRHGPSPRLLWTPQRRRNHLQWAFHGWGDADSSSSDGWRWVARTCWCRGRRRRRGKVGEWVEPGKGEDVGVAVGLLADVGVKCISHLGRRSELGDRIRARLLACSITRVQNRERRVVFTVEGWCGPLALSCKGVALVAVYPRALLASLPSPSRSAHPPARACLLLLLLRMHSLIMR